MALRTLRSRWSKPGNGFSRLTSPVDSRFGIGVLAARLAMAAGPQPVAISNAGAEVRVTALLRDRSDNARSARSARCTVLSDANLMR